jgi:hypothetical protein
MYRVLEGIQLEAIRPDLLLDRSREVDGLLNRHVRVHAPVLYEDGRHARKVDTNTATTDTIQNSTAPAMGPNSQADERVTLLDVEGKSCLPEMCYSTAPSSPPPGKACPSHMDGSADGCSRTPRR